jgi:hypothetical protein
MRTRRRGLRRGRAVLLSRDRAHIARTPHACNTEMANGSPRYKVQIETMITFTIAASRTSRSHEETYVIVPFPIGAGLHSGVENALHG